LIGFAIAFTFLVYLNIFNAKSLDSWVDKVKMGIEEHRILRLALRKKMMTRKQWRMRTKA
jgi:hypothetical protein